MGTTSEKLTYLNGTKQLLKDKINNLGGSIDDNTTFRNYANQLQNVYDNLPKTEYAEGTEITLSNTLKGKLDFDDGKVGFGQASQDSTQGYQLFDITKKTSSTGTVINNGFKLVKSNNRVIRFMLNAIYPAGTYTLSMKQVSHISSITNYFYLNVQKKNGSDYDGVKNGIRINNSTDIEIQIPGEFDTLYFYIDNGETDNAEVTVDDIMLESGTTAHDWEEYTGGQASPNPSYPQTINSVTGNQDVVVSGINKLQQKLPTTTLNGITCTNNSDGSYTFSGTASANVNFRIDQSTTDGTDNLNTYKAPYTMVASIVTGTPIGSMFLGGYSDSESWSTPLCNIGTVRTITSNINNAFCYIRFETGNVVNETIYPMILDGEYTSSNIPNFEPYITPTTHQLSLGDIELCGIGDYKDELVTDRSTGKWYKHSVIKKLVLDGAHQPYWKNSNDSNNYLYYTSIGSKSGDGIIANKLIKKTTSAINGGNGIDKVGMSESGSVFYLNVGYYLSANDLETFKSWLGNNNIDLYYVLKTEDQTDTEITGTLAEQLEAWYNAHSNNGTTIITSNGNLPMIIKVRGLKGE